MEEWTMVPVTKTTRERLRELRLCKRESYDEVLNRVLKVMEKQNGED